MYWIFHTSGMKTAVEIHQLVTTIQQCCIGNSQAQQLQWLWMALSFCLMVKRNFDDIAEVTHSLFCFLRNATGLIPDLEGNTEATSTSDLPSSKEPSCVMGRAAALCCSASATLKTKISCDSEANFPTCLCFSFSSRDTETHSSLAKMYHWRNNRGIFMQ